MTCYVLDTDHLSLFERDDPQVCNRIEQTRRYSSDTLVVTVVTVEEQYIGRLAQIRKANTDEASIGAYARLRQTSLFLADLLVLDYIARANQLFRQFRSAAIRIGT